MTQQITPQVRQWIVEQAQAGHTAESVLQSMLESGWAERFALPLDPSDTGYGHDPGQVGLVVAEASLLLDYFEDVHAATVAYLPRLTEADLGRVVDTRWDPPVTVQVRLMSVVADDTSGTSSCPPGAPTIEVPEVGR